MSSQLGDNKWSQTSTWQLYSSNETSCLIPVTQLVIPSWFRRSHMYVCRLVINRIEDINNFYRYHLKGLPVKWPKSVLSLGCRSTEKDYKWSSVPSLRRINEKGLQYHRGGVQIFQEKKKTQNIIALHLKCRMSLFYVIFQCLHWAFPNELHLSRSVSRRGPWAYLGGGGGVWWAELWPTGEIWDTDVNGREQESG